MSHRLSESIRVLFSDFDANASNTLNTAPAANFIDVSGYNRVMCIAFRTVGTSDVAAAALFVASDVTGTGATQITSTLVASTPASGVLVAASGSISKPDCGMVVMEVDTSDLDATLVGGRFLQVRIDHLVATDEFGILWILGEPRVAKAGLTATYSAP